MPGAQLEDEALVACRRIAGLFQADPRVKVVTLCGSRTSGAAVDTRSDIDLYVYTEAGDYPLDQRRAIIERLGGVLASLGLTFWANGDVWIDARSGIEVDVVYPGMAWIEQELDRLLRRCRHPGVPTCAWHTVRTALILFDRSGWFARPVPRSDQSWPARAAPGYQPQPPYSTRIVPQLPR